jgi:putative two-component system response regulator
VKKRILFVDDEINILESLRRILFSQEEMWEMTFLEEPEEAWRQLLAKDFDLVVMDLKMPGVNGMDLLERTRKFPVVILTGTQDRSIKCRALEHGATDVLGKPVDAEDLLARLNNALRTKESQDTLERHVVQLEELVRQRTSELIQSHQEIVWRLGKFAEERDKKTGNHVIRVGLFSHAIAETLDLDSTFVDTIGLVAPLHDIGKVAISDSILFKNGPLTPEEIILMRRHCWLGAKILRDDSIVHKAFLRWQAHTETLSAAPVENHFLEMAATIAMSHHEKWDGAGYPRKLIGEAIPLEARIVAIADVYDASTSSRPYSPAMSEEWALELLQKNNGSHFDPSVYSAFLKALPKIRSIRSQFADFAKESCIGPPERHECKNDWSNALAEFDCPSPIEFT